MQDSEPPKDPTDKKGEGWDILPIPLVLLITAISICFTIPLKNLWLHASSSDLYSHTILIPIICIYLSWDNRNKIVQSTPYRPLAFIPLIIGFASLYLFIKDTSNPENPEQIENYLAYSIFAYVMFIIASSCLTLGRQTMRTNLFPLLLLLCMVPFTTGIREGIQSFFQHTSAEAAYWLIKLAGIPIFREGLIFEMPTIKMEVAPQCSGLRSSLVLFVTSLVGSFLFLKSPWKRSVFVFLIVPIGILRNAIRILILAWQCYFIHPDMINGWFHKHGGQPLFAITLIPLFITLYLFRKSESTKTQ